MTDYFAFVKLGELCLDFVNSKAWDFRTQPMTDLFTDYDRVVHWCRHLGILSDDDVDHLLELAKRQPLETQAAFEKIIRLRDANYRTLTAVARKQLPAPQDMDILNQILAEAMQHLQVLATPNDFTWAWKKSDTTLDWMLWPVVRSTAELLTSDRVQRIRECGGCYWMFMDTSRNGLRRWCDMKTCGNRAKARRHYERVRGSQG